MSDDAERDASAVPPLIWLNDPLSRDRELVGNKSATLARLLDLGYRVPEGFSVTTTALATGEGAYAGAVLESLARLESPWVARSSSNAEDSPGHAFAGLFITLLNLDDANALLAAIERVRASADGDTTRRYANRLGVDPGAVRMAVLVQSLVRASVAGVAFSRDPDSGLRHVVIEANYGLGETVVEGSVTPDSFTVGASGEILARSLGSKRQKVVAAVKGGQPQRVDVSAAERSAFALDDGRVTAVAEVVRGLEADLGYPVDVEWAFAAERLYLLQARPISTVAA